MNTLRMASAENSASQRYGDLLGIRSMPVAMSLYLLQSISIPTSSSLFCFRCGYLAFCKFSDHSRNRPATGEAAQDDAR